MKFEQLTQGFCSRLRLLRHESVHCRLCIEPPEVAQSWPAYKMTTSTVKRRLRIRPMKFEQLTQGFCSRLRLLRHESVHCRLCIEPPEVAQSWPAYKMTTSTVNPCPPKGGLLQPFKIFLNSVFCRINCAKCFCSIAFTHLLMYMR